MRALVLHPIRSRGGPRDPEDALAEAVSLATALDLDVVASATVPLPRARAGQLFGKGKVEELGARIEEEEVGLVIIDGPLSPVQQRNLEKIWKAKVLDRTGLILEIFGDRAQTREGVLQVELAHLSYQKSRLVRSWTHLERQRGGFGFLGGPGETQIEADRRALDERIDRIKQQLAKVVRTRGQHRAARTAAGLSGRRPRRLHQRRQVDAVQPPDRLGRAGEGHALRHPRPDDARHRPAAGQAGDPVGHRRLHLRPAAPARRRLPRHAGGGARGRPHPPRPRHLPPRERDPGGERPRDPRRARRRRGARRRG